MEATSLANLALKAQLTAVQLDQTMGDSEAEACSFGLPTGFSKAIEGFEDTLLLLRRNTRAVIPHFHPNPVFV
jgi:hypothetical protein